MGIIRTRNLDDCPSADSFSGGMDNRILRLDWVAPVLENGRTELVRFNISLRLSKMGKTGERRRFPQWTGVPVSVSDQRSGQVGCFGVEDNFTLVRFERAPSPEPLNGPMLRSAYPVR